MARKGKRRRTPGPGRNLAVRPGGGPHRLTEEKRASDRERHEIEEQLESDDAKGEGKERPSPAG